MFDIYDISWNCIFSDSSTLYKKIFQELLSLPISIKYLVERRKVDR